MDVAREFLEEFMPKKLVRKRRLSLKKLIFRIFVKLSVLQIFWRFY